ncbi:rCG24036, isoform CRA_f [Rattus norvegicus]|uniref:RCG24036, isoform CRA_f n=1 Tax=Rattus norvegicus TaxID=10116 RepID=A6JWE8_RAT|nr:rCG24036, isoform CRA_f [Rattus norvegicus]
MQELEAKHPLQWVAPERTDKERRTTRPTKEDRNGNSIPQTPAMTFEAIVYKWLVFHPHVTL